MSVCVAVVRQMSVSLLACLNSSGKQKPSSSSYQNQLACDTLPAKQTALTVDIMCVCVCVCVCVKVVLGLRVWGKTQVQRKPRLDRWLAARGCMHRFANTRREERRAKPIAEQSRAEQSRAESRFSPLAWARVFLHFQDIESRSNLVPPSSTCSSS